MAPLCSCRLLVVFLFLFVASAARSRRIGELDATLRQNTAADNATTTDTTGSIASNGTAMGNHTMVEPDASGGGGQPPSDGYPGMGGNFKPEKPAAFNGDCEGYARVEQRSTGKVMEAWNAFLVMSYFLGVTCLLFGAVAAVRTQLLGVRGRPALVACLVCGCGLAIAATLALVMRSVLAPVDASIFGVNTAELKEKTVNYCEATLDGRWPTERKWDGVEWYEERVDGKPYLGKPPRDTWVFWLFVVSCYTGAIILLLSIIRVRLEDRMPRRDIKVIDDGPPTQLPVHHQV